MSFSDVFKKSFLEGYVSIDISPKMIAVTMLITAVFAVYLFFVYRIFVRKTFYNKNFNISISLIAMITAAIIMTIQSSIVVSLGMVGALSIVRFRTAIKDPMDLVFLFWSIAVGIICGAGLSGIAIVLSAVVTLMLIVLDTIPLAKAPQILVINANRRNIEGEVLKILESYKTIYKVKSRTIEPDRIDLLIEVRGDKGQEIVAKVAELEGLRRCSLVSHDGEVTF